MIDFNAHFDGKVIVPEQAVDLPRNRSFVVHVEAFAGADLATNDPPQSAPQWLVEMQLTTNCLLTSRPSTIICYGTPKRG